MNPVLDVRDAVFSYDGENNIFEHIDFDVDRGEVFLIVGPNGCGKSTLIDNVLGLKKLDGGGIRFGGRSIHEMAPKEIAAHVAYVPQNHIKSFSYRVIEIVEMGRVYANSALSGLKERDKEIALQALAQVGMEGFAERDYTTLSGGELQLVLIARALAQQAGLLVMDEPTAHLDFRHELNVMETIASLVKHENISVVMATHSLNQAFYLENEGIKTTVALMNERNFEQIGTPTDVLNPENLEKAFHIEAEVAHNTESGRKFILALRNVGGKRNG